MIIFEIDHLKMRLIDNSLQSYFFEMIFHSLIVVHLKSNFDLTNYENSLTNFPNLQSNSQSHYYHHFDHDKLMNKLENEFQGLKEEKRKNRRFKKKKEREMRIEERSD